MNLEAAALLASVCFALSRRELVRPSLAPLLIPIATQTSAALLLRWSLLSCLALSRRELVRLSLAPLVVSIATQTRADLLLLSGIGPAFPCSAAGPYCYPD